MSVQKSKEYQKTTDYKKSVVDGQKQWRDSLYGPEKDHIKICENKNCNKPFQWFGREGTTKYKNTRFCCVPCAKSRSEYWDKNITRYRSIAFKHHDKKCVVCGFDKIVAVHYYDHNKDNNDPTNLIPLCPNHHEMIHHSLYTTEITAKVNEWLKK